jgi:hypothetical protein
MAKFDHCIRVKLRDGRTLRAFQHYATEADAFGRAMASMIGASAIAGVEVYDPNKERVRYAAGEPIE